MIRLFLNSVLVFSAIWFATGTTFAQKGTTTKNGPRIGEIPPPLALSRIVQGPTVETVTWEKLKGKVVVLEFWDTACVPCVQAIPHLNELVDQFSLKPVVFLSVSDDNEDQLKYFVKRRPIKGWLALDGAFKPTAAAFDLVAICLSR
jgi:thiol-disulfide isomerase/thioredoxin